MAHDEGGVTRSVGLLAILALFAVGCRSMTERTYVGGTDEKDEVAERHQAAEAIALGDMVGSLIYFVATGCPGPVESGH